MGAGATHIRKRVRGRGGYGMRRVVFMGMRRRRARILSLGRHLQFVKNFLSSPKGSLGKGGGGEAFFFLTPFWGGVYRIPSFSCVFGKEVSQHCRSLFLRWFHASVIVCVCDVPRGYELCAIFRAHVYVYVFCETYPPLGIARERTLARRGFFLAAFGCFLFGPLQVILLTIGPP